MIIRDDFQNIRKHMIYHAHRIIFGDIFDLTLAGWIAYCLRHKEVVLWQVASSCLNFIWLREVLIIPF